MLMLLMLMLWLMLHLRLMLHRWLLHLRLLLLLKSLKLMLMIPLRLSLQLLLQLHLRLIHILHILFLSLITLPSTSLLFLLNSLLLLQLQFILLQLIRHILFTKQAIRVQTPQLLQSLFPAHPTRRNLLDRLCHTINLSGSASVIRQCAHVNRRMVMQRRIRIPPPDLPRPIRLPPLHSPSPHPTRAPHFQTALIPPPLLFRQMACVLRLPTQHASDVPFIISSVGDDCLFPVFGRGGFDAGFFYNVEAVVQGVGVAELHQGG